MENTNNSDPIKAINFTSDTVNLDNSNLSLKNIKELVNIIKDNKTVKTLFLGDNQLGLNIDNIKELGILIRENKTIQRLMLNGNKLGNDKDNLKELGFALKDNSTIERLYLFNNEIIQFFFFNRHHSRKNSLHC